MTELIQVSSLEKVLPKHEYFGKQINEMTVLHGEEGAYQIAFSQKHVTAVRVSVKSDIADFVKVHTVGNVPVGLATFEEAFSDPDYISTEPGIFPDILNPVSDGEFEACGYYQALWITVERNAPVGEHKIVITLSTEDEEKSCEMKYTVLPIVLPESDMIYTQWFHTDCIYSYYNVPVWSEKHWELTEKFVKTAVKNGINMILTPIFTPPLDTEIGGERPTVQLVGIVRDGDSYSFDFSLLERWVNMCMKCGVKYFEMAHLFTQWGAKYTPKIMAYENGEEKRIFGWDVTATDERYEIFLSQLLPALKSFFKERGLLDKVYFHVSDEPNGDMLEDYMRAKKLSYKYLPDCKFLDAMSEYEFYEKGAVERPVVILGSIDGFIGKVGELWGYYCCYPVVGYSNRMITMPSARTRYIALQMYKSEMKGFLQWGYNFYYARLSKRKLNPFFETDGGGHFPSGDAFSVYPGEDGPLESIRLVVFYHALQDLSAMRLLQKYVGYDRVLEIIESIAGEVAFEKCTSDAELVFKVRNAINDELKKVCLK